MKRKEFVIKMGTGVLVACSGSCLLSACSPGDDGMQNTGENTGDGGNNDSKPSIDIGVIPEVGDQRKSGRVLFIRIDTGNSTSSFVALEAICPHQSGALVYVPDQQIVQCQLHAAQYELDGDVVRGPQNSSGSTRDLKVYTTALSGTTLTANT